jgi:hypothetical protein
MAGVHATRSAAGQRAGLGRRLRAWTLERVGRLIGESRLGNPDRAWRNREDETGDRSGSSRRRGLGTRLAWLAALGRIMAGMRRNLPTGTVTFLLTEVEGSTKNPARCRGSICTG